MTQTIAEISQSTRITTRALRFLAAEPTQEGLVSTQEGLVSLIFATVLLARIRRRSQEDLEELMQASWRDVDANPEWRRIVELGSAILFGDPLIGLSLPRSCPQFG